jgi:hypothetical protein
MYSWNMSNAENIVKARAEVAMRVEDYRIARKHRCEAASRSMTPESIRAYRRASAWENLCREREESARAALLRISSIDRLHTYS